MMNHHHLRSTLLVASIWLLSALSLHGAVKSVTGSDLQFDAYADGHIDATLKTGKLGIANSSPSANLHVSGNTATTELVVGTAYSASNSSLVTNNIAFPIQSASSNNTVLSDRSYVLANTSSKSLSLQLPNPSQMNGRVYNIKKTSKYNEVFVHANGNLIDQGQGLTLSANALGHAQLISDGTQWHVMGQKNVDTDVGGNLVVWMPFDQAGVDSGAELGKYGLTYTRNNFATSGNGWVAGKSGNAIQFDGVDDTVTIPDHSGLGSGFLTISFWIKLDVAASVGGADLTLLQKKSTNGNRSYWIRLKGSGSAADKLQCVSYDTTSPTQNGEFTTNGSTIISTGTWAHVAFSFSSTDILIGVNGSSSTGTNSTGLGILDSTEPLIIGGFQGAIDDIKIFDRPLTATEITSLYQSSMN